MSCPRILPIITEGVGRRRRTVAVLHLDADECESIAYALGLHDGGAEELLATAHVMREMDAEDDE